MARNTYREGDNAKLLPGDPYKGNANVQVSTDGKFISAPKLKLADIVKSKNVAELLDSDFLDYMGQCVVNDYDMDNSTRIQWLQKNDQAIRLAMQVLETKSFPWTNCSNVKFPLITIAALQFLARISILTKGRNPVRMEAVGADPDGAKSARAKRIGQHMSMQLVDEDVNWVDDDETLKLATSILGVGIKKTRYDSVQGRVVSEYIPAQNFVVDYFCKSPDTARRATEVMYWSPNRVAEHVRRGLFCAPLTQENLQSPNSTNLLKVAADEAAGVQMPASADEYRLYEQHCWWDLDGDNYEEPYVVTVDGISGQVLRVVAAFYDEGDVHRKNDAQIIQLENHLQDMEASANAGDANQTQEEKDEALRTVLQLRSDTEKKIEELRTSSDNIIVRIEQQHYYTRYLFIPAPDGGFYGMGFGSLLGPLNESVNTVINQLIDAGTMANSGGGFLGRGVKMKGGKTSFDPFEWKPVDSTGDDLRKNIFPLPVREPSNVLFTLLGLLVTYSEKVSGATDIMTGVSPGQNTPAETSRNTVEQGMMLFSGIYGRMYRSFRQELTKIYDLNRLFLPSSPHWLDLTQGPDAILARDDYKGGPLRIFPAASPEAVSITQRREKANALQNVANATPGFNKYLTTRYWLEAWEFEGIDQLFPDPTGPNAVQTPENPKLTIEKMKIEQKKQEHQDEMQLAIAELRVTAQESEARIAQLQAQAAKLLAEADGVDTGQQIALLNAQIGAAKAKQDGLLSAITVMQKAHTDSKKHELERQKLGVQKKSAGDTSLPALPAPSEMAPAQDAQPSQQLAAPSAPPEM